MKYIFLHLMVWGCCILLTSCYKDVYVPYYYSAITDLTKEFKGKSSSYIIKNYPYPITDTKRIDNEYSILVCERYRSLYGTGRTYFYMKDGYCYDIKTNEYKMKKESQRVSIFNSYWWTY